MKKTLITILVTVLVCFGVFGTTLAYLMDKTATITNTFTYGNVDIELAETTGPTYKMLPGHVYTKDPTVTVKANSEDCWVFIKVEKSANFNTFMTCAIDSTWGTAIETNGTTSVYAQKVTGVTADRDLAVLAGNKVTINNVTQTELNGAKGNEPTLKVTAYAVQADGFDEAADAWAKAETLG